MNNVDLIGLSTLLSAFAAACVALGFTYKDKITKDQLKQKVEEQKENLENLKQASDAENNSRELTYQESLIQAHVRLIVKPLEDRIGKLEVELEESNANSETYKNTIRSYIVYFQELFIVLSYKLPNDIFSEVYDNLPVPPKELEEEYTRIMRGKKND